MKEHADTTRKTETISVRTVPGIKDALRRLAGHEHRSIANTVEVLIIERCRKTGIKVEVADLARQDGRTIRRRA